MRRQPWQVEGPPVEPERERARERVQSLPDKALDTMRTIGTYRAVEARELDAGTVRGLKRAGLVQTRWLLSQRTGKAQTAVALTRQGWKALDAHRTGNDAQRYAAGFGHPSDLAHDIAVYPACRDLVKQIEKGGGKVKRIVTSDEFMRGVGVRMNAPGRESIAQRRAAAARDLDLPRKPDGRLEIPDARIEYVDVDGQERHEDVEVVTRNYSAARVAGLAKSGFRMHSADGPRKMITDDHDLEWL